MLLDTAAPILNWRSKHLERFSAGVVRAPKEILWQRLVWFSVVFAVGWMIALAFHGLVATAKGYGWPQNSFLYNPRYRFTDLTQSVQQAIGQNPYTDNPTQVGGTYFPFAYIVLRRFGQTPSADLILGFIGATLISLVGVWAWWLRRQWGLWNGDARRPMIALLSFFIIVCNYPVVFGLDRGNIDPLVACLLYASLELTRMRHGLSGGLVLALSAASKIFPFAAVLYGVRRRRFGAATVALLLLVALVVLPAMTFEGTLAHSLSGFKRNMNGFRELYIYGGFSAHWSADGINALRVLARWSHQPIDIRAVVHGYERAALLYAAVVSMCAIFVVKETWRELLAIALIMLVFPNITNDYKLVFLLPALLEWLGSSAKGWRSALFGVATALLFVPKHYYFPSSDEASISCAINPTLVFALTAVLWPTGDENTQFVVQATAMQRRFSGILMPARAKAAARVQR